MPELNNKTKGFLTVPVKGTEYQIPLASSLKVKWIKKLAKAVKGGELEMIDFMIEFFEQYIPEDVLEDLDQDELVELFTLWKKANEEGERITLGESSASSSS